MAWSRFCDRGGAMSDKRKLVVLPTRELTKRFIEKTASMVIVDYDLDELAVGMVSCLSYNDKQHHDQMSNDFIRTVRDHGKFGSKVVQDGVILAEATEQYMEELGKLVKQAQLYDGNGTLDYMFDRFVGGDIVLTEWPH